MSNELATCSCSFHCQTQEEMTNRHGTPAQFTKAVWDALDMVTLEEALKAIAKYTREWEAAPKEVKCDSESNE